MTLRIYLDEFGGVRVDCDHSKRHMTRRQNSNATWHCAVQCQECGIMIAQVAKPANFASLPLFDDKLRKRMQDDAESVRMRERESHRRKYHDYLLTPAWHERRRLVLQRAGGLCEGCRVRKATQVHHLTYDHVFNELLFELVAICDRCHEVVHEKEARRA